ncbi:hypothetical protein QJQ45_007139 [Haematococcus lacustris]|nr:hypothetical protein QJQ45_007139 [Haematococcus lacustris]
MDDKLEPMRLERQRFGCGVACDGFTSTSIRPLLCFTICSPSGAELESVIDTSGHAKTAQFYYEQLKAAILRVGVDDVVAVFSDNARACVKAGQKLEDDDELRVFFMPCGSHSLDLALKDIGKLPWAAETILLAKSLIHFIRARHFPLDLFRTVSQELAAREAGARGGGGGGGGLAADGTARMGGGGVIGVRTVGAARMGGGGVGGVGGAGTSRMGGGGVMGLNAVGAGRTGRGGVGGLRQAHGPLQAGAYAGGRGVGGGPAAGQPAPQHARPPFKVLELLRVGDTRFASVLIMFERLVRVFPVLVTAQDAGTRSGAAKIRSLVQQQAGMHSSSWRQRVHQLNGQSARRQPVASKVYFGVQRMVQEVEAAIEQLGVPDGDIIMAALQRRTAMFLRPLHGAAALLDPEYRAHLARDHTLCQTLKEDFFKVVDKLTPATADECKVQLVDYLRDPKYNCFMAMAVRTPPHKWWDVSASATSCERAWSSTDFIQNKRRNRLKSDTADKLIRLYFNSRLLERAAKGAASKAWEWEGEEGEGEVEGEEEEPGMFARPLAVNEPALNEMMARDAMRLQVEQAAQDAEEAILAGL